MGVSPVLIHFRIFHEINHPTIGVSPFMDPPLASMSWAELVAGCGLGGFSDLEASGQSKRRAVWQHFWIKHSRKIWKNTVERSVGHLGWFWISNMSCKLRLIMAYFLYADEFSSEKMGDPQSPPWLWNRTILGLRIVFFTGQFKFFFRIPVCLIFAAFGNYNLVFRIVFAEFWS